MEQVEELSHESERLDPHAVSPADLFNFLPWAFRRVTLSRTLIINKNIQKDYIPVQTKAGKSIKTVLSEIVKLSDPQLAEKLRSIQSLGDDNKMSVRIELVYCDERVIHFKFLKNRHIPRTIIQILGLIIKFHPYLTAFTIDTGMDKYSIYELSKFLPQSHITEIFLDNSFLREANYYVLLENATTLKHLSLARCKINDAVVLNIASKLVYPMPASKTLALLNLSSNRITDEGAKHLAEALKSNRHLNYLNLANNALSDAGAEAILNTLVVFSLSKDEILALNSRYLNYLKENEATVQTIPKGKISQVVKEKDKKKLKTATINSNKQEQSTNDFKDPFNKENTIREEDAVYSRGNNTLCYLNLAYNNIGYLSLKKLHSVFQFQHLSNRKPKGLTNVRIEGNPLPTSCKELYEIDRFMAIELMSHSDRTSREFKKGKKT